MRLIPSLGDGKTVRDGLMHYLLADVLFALLLGASASFILLFFLRNNANLFFSGAGGFAFEIGITWSAVFFSAKLLRRRRSHDALGVALVATIFSVVSFFVIVPYLRFFSDISRAPLAYIILKDVSHVCVFYTASLVYLSGNSIRGLLKDEAVSTR